MATRLNAECPTCKTPLPVIVDKESVVRVTICKKCGDEFEYSAWVILSKLNKDATKNLTMTKIELERIAVGHHTRPLTESRS